MRRLGHLPVCLACLLAVGAANAAELAPLQVTGLAPELEANVLARTSLQNMTPAQRLQVSEQRLA